MSDLPLMFPTATEQTMLFLWSCVMGVGFGVVYDLLRILRIAVKPGALMVAIQDIIFLFFCAICIFIFSIEAGGGMVRLFYIIGSGLGFIVYYCTVGRMVFFAANKIISAIKWLFLQLYRMLLRPILYLFRWIKRKTSPFFSSIVLKIKNNFGKMKKRLKDSTSLLYNKTKQTKNFEGHSIEKEGKADGQRSATKESKT